jgi:hypothetical protein
MHERRWLVAVRLPRSVVEVLEVAMQERRWLVAAPEL